MTLKFQIFFIVGLTFVSILNACESLSCDRTSCTDSNLPLETTFALGINDFYVQSNAAGTNYNQVIWDMSKDKDLGTWRTEILFRKLDESKQQVLEQLKVVIVSSSMQEAGWYIHERPSPQENKVLLGELKEWTPLTTSPLYPEIKELIDITNTMISYTYNSTHTMYALDSRIVARLNHGLIDLLPRFGQTL